MVVMTVGRTAADRDTKTGAGAGAGAAVRPRGLERGLVHAHAQE